MPSWRAASISVVPSATATFWPSIVISTVRRGRGGGITGSGPRGTGILASRSVLRGAPDAHGVSCVGGVSLKIGNRESADSMALEAVWPRPQMEASRIACPSSWSSVTSEATEPSGRSVASRWSSSSWRTVPTRQGTHWPHDSSRKNWAIRRRIWRRSTRVVERHHHRRAERGADGARPLEGQGDVELVGPHEGAGRAAEQDGLQASTSSDSAGQVEQLAQGDPERRLVDAGALHMAGDAEELGAGRALGADGGEGLPPLDRRWGGR